MERENHINPELTGQEQNAYSNSMPEGIPSPEMPNAGQAGDRNMAEIRTPEEIRQARINDIRGVLRDNPNMVVTAKGPLENELARLLTSPISETSSPQSQRADNVDLSADVLADAVRRGIETANSRDRGDRDEAVRVGAINTDSLSDPILRSIAEDVNSAIESERYLRDPELLNELLLEVQDRVTHQPPALDEARQLEERLLQMKGMVSAFEKSVKKGTRETLRLYLTTDDFERLEEDPMAWINNELDRIYELSNEGQELDSQQLRDAQSLQSQATKYLTRISASPEVIKKFDEEFLTKLNVMYARSTVQQKSMEGIQNMTTRLGTHGILNTLSFENGMVGMMHNRIQELYDDVRVRSREHHITPEEHSKIQSKVINEFTQLVKSDDVLVKKIIKGDERISESRRNSLIKAAVTRSVRTGYDHFVASQREAVIVSRGEALPTDQDLQGILADPSQLFNIFNFEQMLIAKFKLLNHEQQEFLSALKRRYAESVLHNEGVRNIRGWAQKRAKSDPEVRKAIAEGEDVKEAALVSYGSSLMRDIVAVNDFYSSGWRIERFVVQINEIFKYKVAEQRFASSNPDEYKRLKEILNTEFMTEKGYRGKEAAQREYSNQIGARLKGMSYQELQEAKSKADTFGLFMRLRAIKSHASNEKYEDVWEKIAMYKPEDIVKLFREKGSEKELAEVNNAFREMGLQSSEGGTLYDAFKDEYGAAIRLVREKGYAGDMPEQIDFSQIISNPHYAEYKNVLVRALAKGNDPDAIQIAEEKVKNLAKLYSKLSEFAGNKETINKLVEDIRFEGVYTRTYDVSDALLDKMENADTNVGMTQVSKKLDPESAGNAFRRTMGDAEKATAAQAAYFGFLRAESTEEKLKLALEAGEAASNYGGPAARAKAFRYLFGSYVLMGQVADGRWLSSKTLLEALDVTKLPFNQPINELQKIFGPQAPAFTNDQVLKFLEDHRGDFVSGSEDKKEAEALWHEMRRLGKIRPKDRATLMSIRLLIYAMMVLGLEGYNVTKEGLKSEDLN